VYANLDEALVVPKPTRKFNLLQGSQGLNLALHFLSGAINFDPVVTVVDSKKASQIVWLDAFITNVDRTFRNTNMLIWHKEYGLLIMGQVFIFIILGQLEKHAQSPFALIKDHVLLPQASMLQEADALFKTILTPETLQAIVNLIPLEWLDWQDTDESPDAIRESIFSFYRCA
jgi:hypothetical protein